MHMDPIKLLHHHQDMSSNETLESMLICTKASSLQVDDNNNNNKKPRPQDEQAQKCPRCDSCNTKFCYYNNYSLTQPRYFCKSCKRYWTKGGTLRNVPVGGGCRKNNYNNKRSSSPASSKITTTDQNHPLLPYQSTDLSLAFATLQNGQPGFGISNLGNIHCSFLDTLRYGHFLETPPICNDLQNVYYGKDHYYENVGNMSHQGMGNLPYEDLMTAGSGGSSATTVEQEGTQGRVEACDVNRSTTEEDGDKGMMPGEVDAIERQTSWINGFGSCNWRGHGSLNSPLM